MSEATEEQSPPLSEKPSLWQRLQFWKKPKTEAPPETSHNGQESLVDESATPAAAEENLPHPPEPSKPILTEISGDMATPKPEPVIPVQEISIEKPAETIIEPIPEVVVPSEEKVPPEAVGTEIRIEELSSAPEKPADFATPLPEETPPTSIPGEPSADVLGEMMETEEEKPKRSGLKWVFLSPLAVILGFGVYEYAVWNQLLQSSAKLFSVPSSSPKTTVPKTESALRVKTPPPTPTPKAAAKPVNPKPIPSHAKLEKAPRHLGTPLAASPLPTPASVPASVATKPEVPTQTAPSGPELYFTDSHGDRFTPNGWTVQVIKSAEEWATLWKTRVANAPRFNFDRNIALVFVPEGEVQARWSLEFYDVLEQPDRLLVGFRLVPRSATDSSTLFQYKTIGQTTHPIQLQQIQ